MTKIKIESECKRAGVDFETAFRWQYLLTQRHISQTALIKYTFNGWNFYVGDGVSVANLEDVKGRQVGLFIGVGVDQQGLVEGNYQIPSLDLDSDGFFEAFEAWLFYVAGRYNVLISRGKENRFYSDAVGMNGMVYDHEGRQVASSLGLCLERDVIDHPLYDHSYIERGEGNYSLFHTKDKGVRRGNPNFYLDLSDFTETRFWPRTEDFTTLRSRQDIYAEIISRTAQVIKNINEKFKTVLPLSGGQDSRLLVAIAGEDLAGVDLYFTHITNYASRIDATIAGEIAKYLNLDHEIYDRRDFNIIKGDVVKLEAEYHAALGMKMPLKNGMARGLHKGVPDRWLILRGHQTDFLRAVFIDKLGADGRNNLRWQIKRLLIVPRKEFNGKIYKRFAPEYKSWIATLPENSLERQVDLMFLEIYYSSTIGALFPALSRNFFMSPFNSRHLVSLSLSIEESYRRSSFAVNDILLTLNPELHEIPFDYEFGGARGLDSINDREQMAEVTAARRKDSEARKNLMEKYPNIAATADLPI